MSQTIGTLLPLTALLGKHKSINLFENGQIFVDWLSNTNQQAWQMLPIHPTAALEKNLFASPYSGFGVGINPLFVKKTDYPEIDPLFARDNQDWLFDHSLFMALTDHFNTDLWKNWPSSIRKHEPQAVEKWSLKLKTKIDYYSRQQSYLFNEYHKLRLVANQKNIKIIGDVPFYLTLNSPLVWAHQDCFIINRVGNLPYVSGAAGNEQFPRQVWGHPLYNSKNLEGLMNFWKIRLSYAAKLYDQVRLDSAIRFYTYGKMHPITDAKDTTGRGLGDKLFVPLIEYCQQIQLHVFCEDITGYSLVDLHKAMRKMEISGVWIFTLILSGKSLPAENAICYTSNHDTHTLLGFVKSLTARQKKFVLEILNLTDQKQNVLTLVGQIKTKLMHICPHLILPYQDWILDPKRLNTPGTVSRENWHYTIDLSKLKAP